MADAPNDPKGPGSQSPPLDPGVAGQFQGMEDKLRDANAMADSAKKFADEAERGANELDKLGRGIKKQIDAYKELTALAKRKLDVLKVEWKDSKVARKELEHLVELHEEGLKTSRAGSKEFRQMTSNV